MPLNLYRVAQKKGNDQYFDILFIAWTSLQFLKELIHKIKATQPKSMILVSFFSQPRFIFGMKQKRLDNSPFCFFWATLYSER